MIPVPLAGIAITGSALLAKYAAAKKEGKPAEFLRYNPGPLQMPASIKLPDISDQFQNQIQNKLQDVIGGISSAVSQMKKSIIGENYNSIVEEFLPAGSELINPRHISNSGELGLSDLDGDSQEELIASYRNNSGVGTIILKKENEQWFKIAEILNPEYSGIIFRDTSDITGTGKQQLLFGFPLSDKKMSLQAYSLESRAFVKLFERNCSRFEILGGKKTESRHPIKEQLAFWNKDDTGKYSIDLVQWNGLELEPVNDKTKYYTRKVIPMHAQEVKHDPYSPLGWYNFASVLAEAGYTKDALDAVNMALSVDKKAAYNEKLNELKSSLE